MIKKNIRKIVIPSYNKHDIYFNSIIIGKYHFYSNKK